MRRDEYVLRTGKMCTAGGTAMQSVKLQFCTLHLDLRVLEGESIMFMTDAINVRQSLSSPELQNTTAIPHSERCDAMQASLRTTGFKANAKAVFTKRVNGSKTSPAHHPLLQDAITKHRGLNHSLRQRSSPR
ncbi:uncharacterized protein N7477_006421 [Penicillium maclennaniae]|uniref:uncharacterized protein n=1 Tax=Penicillium maclennaniae TaxID=1343394 RepID=UPI0025405D28|nr:uncharacterized protein N7477_006421 [Penicillium maclennaniae]KAJ5667851.1 hypothetical protein N7477_006421 [Penicillium maclennaniae]